MAGYVETQFLPQKVILCVIQLLQTSNQVGPHQEGVIVNQHIPLRMRSSLRKVLETTKVLEWAK
jgi:hypothetical protein